ncbi:MAG: type VI secretion system ATPase TssH [Planctomycetes bacterium]|nr:type VI secretion system ATPase TssH [Planctomycetota bacterium]
MAHVDMKLLRQQLNNVCVRTLETAAGTCINRTHYEITIEHVLAPLLDTGSCDLLCICDHFKVDVSKLRQALTRSLEDLKTGNSGRPQFSPFLADWLSEAWQISSLELSLPRIRSGALVLALVRNPSRAYFTDYTDEFSKVAENELKTKFIDITGASIEIEAAGTAAAPGASPAAGGIGDALTQFTSDLTEKARAGKIDPVIGREQEIRQVIDILMRRFQNNPLIVGDPGTGKTAIAEGFALRVVAGDVPNTLANITLRSLDVGLLTAGANVKGEFERRLKEVIREVNASNASANPIILFIDEAHTLIGGGSGSDAANLLKPALARGELRTVAATTWAEYKKYIEKDPPFAQRFGLVKLDEPSVAVAIEMLRGTKDKFESHHKVRILDNAVRSAVAMSNQYLSDQQLPRKAVSLLDTASARVAVGMNTTPGPLEDIRRRIIQLDTAIRAIERDAEAGHEADVDELDDLKNEREEQQKAFDELDKRWKGERELAQEVIKLRAEIEAAGDGQAEATPAEEPAGADAEVKEAVPAEAAEPLRTIEDIRAELAAATAKLDGYVGDATPLVPLQVDDDVVSQVLSDWTGIPAGKMVKNQAEAILHFEDRIGERIIGQDHALREIGNRLRIASGKLQDPKLPLAVIFMVGPSGTGKTETALAVADLIFGGERFMTAINMTEYSSSMNVSRLIGSAPGLVGFGEGGVLTEAVRQRPYSVVLLDEMEKAHMDVNLLFMQVFDKGELQDAEGRTASFKNTVIMLTSNEGSDMVMEMSQDPDEMPSLAELRTAVQPILEKRFTPAFIGRLTVIPFYPLHPDTMRKIVDLKLNKIRERLVSIYKLGFEADAAVGDAIAGRCNVMTTGARNINLIINETILPAIARQILEIMGEERKYEKLKLGVNEEGEFTYEFV